MALNSTKSVFILEFLLDGALSVLKLSHVNSECFILGGLLALAFSVGEEDFHEFMVVNVVIVLEAFKLELKADEVLVLEDLKVGEVMLQNID